VGRASSAHADANLKPPQRVKLAMERKRIGLVAMIMVMGKLPPGQ
jgi:hypothetical protein